MNDIQDTINDRRRQRLTIDLVACVLSNQLDGHGSEIVEQAAQKQLLLEAAVESQKLREEIENLVGQRDG